MSQDRFRLGGEVFDTARQLRGTEQSAYLAEACAGDDALRREVESLLEHDGLAGDDYLSVPALGSEVGAKMLPQLVEELSSWSEPVRPGEILGDFRIVREIRRGGMGAVYEAEQLSMRRRVALKLAPAPPEDEGAVDEGALEPELAGTLNHPGIVKVYTRGRSSGWEFFAMELVVGAPLDRVLERLRPHRLARITGSDLVEALAVETDRVRPEQDEARALDADLLSALGQCPFIELVCRIVIDVADALEHAHRHGLVHRDVKPSNILVRPDGRAVLTDFGLARPRARGESSRLFRFAGTRGYAAPEQVDGHPLDRRADVFALGASLFELLTLSRPFQSSTTIAELEATRSSKPAPLPRHLNAQIPRDLEMVCLKALQKPLEDRYPSAGALAEDLRRFLSYRPILARPPHPVRRAWQWARRNAWLSVTIAALALVVMGGGSGFMYWQLEMSARLRRAAERANANAAEARAHAAEAMANEKRARRASAEASASFADLAARQGDWDAALEHYDRALHDGHPDPVRLRIGRIEAWQGLFEKERALEELVQLAKEPELGRYEGKVRLLEGILRAGRSNAADAGRASLLAAVQTGQLSTAETALAAAYLTHDLTRMAQQLEVAMANDPHRHRAATALGPLLLFLGRLEDARHFSAVFRAQYPEDPVGRFVEGMCLVLTQRDKSRVSAIVEELRSRGTSRSSHAADLLETHARILPDPHVFDTGFLVELWRRHGIEPLEAAAPSSGSGGQMLLTSLIALWKELKASNSQSTAPPALARTVRHLLSQVAKISLQTLFTGASKPSELRQIFDDLAEIYPVAPVYMLRGLAELAAGAPERAESSFLRAVEAPSPLPLPRAPRFFALEAQWDQFRRATDEPERARARERALGNLWEIARLDGLSRPELQYLGACALELGVPETAGAFAERRLLEDPGDLDAYLALARAARARSNAGHALRLVEVVLSRDPGHSEALELRDQLRAAMGLVK